MSNDRNDISEIENPDSYGCHIYRYRRGHSILVIDAWTDVDRLFIIFEEVVYFSGLVIWKSANFQPMPNDECIRVMKLAGHGRNGIVNDQFIIEIGYRLYTVPNTNPEVKVLSRIAYWTRNFELVEDISP